MSPLIDVTLRSSAIVLVAFVVLRALSRRSAAARHAVLACAVLAASAVGPLSLALPAWHVPAPWLDSSEPAAAPAAPASAAIDVSSTTDRPQARASESARFAPAATVWAAGFFVCAGWLAVGFGRLVWIARRARPIADPRWRRIADQVCAAHGVTRRVALLQTEHPDLVATCGVRRPRLLLPADAHIWSEERVRVVLSHELAHVRRCDWAVQMGAELLRSAYWFNPLMWLACRQLRLESERACDDVVLGGGVQAPDYAMHLLEIARTARPRGSAWASGMPMIRPSMLERRVAAMLNPALKRGGLSRRSLAASIALVLAFTLPIAAVRAGQNGPLPLTGTIYDDTGAVLPGVELTLEDSQQFKWQATTDASGRFQFPPVQPGQYVLETALPGFKALRNEFTLRSARDWDRAITLAVGELLETVMVTAQRPAKPSAHVQSEPQRIRVGGNIRAPRKVTDVNPVYPPSMREAGREGTVPIQAVIGVDGTVASLRILGAEIHPDFAKAAADAVRQWVFTPTLLNGAPVEVVMMVRVTFSLSE